MVVDDATKGITQDGCTQERTEWEAAGVAVANSSAVLTMLKAETLQSLPAADPLSRSAPTQRTSRKRSAPPSSPMKPMSRKAWEAYVIECRPVGANSGWGLSWE